MKGNSMEMKFRRCPSEKAERHYVERRDERICRDSRDARLEYYRSEEKKRHSKDSRALGKKSQKEPRGEREYYKTMKRDKSYRHISPFLARREGIHRNSPVELVVKGCRNTDSSSSEPESNHSDHKNYGNKWPKRKHSEESYEELSRKKRQIESELSALLAEEEAEYNGVRDDKKRSARNQAFHERKMDYRMDRPIKQERISDDERGNRNSRRRSSPKRSGEKMDWGKRSSSDSKKTVKDKAKPNFGLSGKLTEDTNTFNGVVIKYNEPPEARKPKRRWRLYPFKGETPLEFIPIHRQSAYLLGRTRLIADIPIDHPSCSKQHAVLQYRLVDYKREDGSKGKRLRPYIIDLESSNGTFVNNQKIEPRRYVELFEKDVIKFGFSSREYVILHDQSKDESLVDDDDVIEENV